MTSRAGEDAAAVVWSARDWARLVAGLVAVFALFQWTATRLASDRGQAGIIVAAVVVLATLAVERWRSGTPLAAAAVAVGLGRPCGPGLAVAAAIGGALLLVVPLFAQAAGSSVSVLPEAPQWLPGLFAQAGIAEEVLFRGYLFGRLRRGRRFWRAAVLSMVPFVIVHLWLFTSMPWPIASAAILLAVVVSFPFAHLYELGGQTVWPPALLHTVVQAVPKVVVVTGVAADAFPLIWMLASVLLPPLALLIRRAA